MKLLVFILVIGLASFGDLSKPEESPGFFLKVTKNVPRLGRRSDPNWLAKSRIYAYYDDRNFSSWFRELIRPNSMAKRRMQNPIPEIYEYNMVQPVDAQTLLQLLSHDVLSPQSVKFVHWKDFDLALQRDPDLYAKVSSIGRIPDENLKEKIRITKVKSPGKSREEVMMYSGDDNDLYGSNFDYK